MKIHRTMWFRWTAVSLLAAFLSPSANANDHLGGGGTGGGTAGGSTATNTGSSSGYSNTGAIAGGAAAAVGGVTALLLYRRSKSYVTGCVQRGNDPNSLVLHSKNGKQQWLLTGDATVPVGERVRLHGKRRSNGKGEVAFQYDRIVKSFGSCEQTVNLWRSSDQARTMRSQLRKLGFAHTD